jgi:hypothetical protein
MFDEAKEPVDIFADVDATPPPGRAPSSGLPGQPPTVVAEKHGPSKILLFSVLLVVLGGVGFGVWALFLRDDAATPSDTPIVADDAAKIDTTVVVAQCGNGVCEESEDQLTCAADCMAESVCGNDVCETDETEISCALDCGTVAVCGNEACEEGEDALTCAADCPVVMICGNGVCEQNEDQTSCSADCEAPTATQEDSDTDGDGLSDVEERQLGTDVMIADTDDDGLTDREEARIYATDPTDADSDGDGFVDGEEVKNGYNPNGTGRLFEVPGR